MAAWTAGSSLASRRRSRSFLAALKGLREFRRVLCRCEQHLLQEPQGGQQGNPQSREMVSLWAGRWKTGRRRGLVKQAWLDPASRRTLRSFGDASPRGARHAACGFGRQADPQVFSVVPGCVSPRMFGDHREDRQETIVTGSPGFLRGRAVVCVVPGPSFSPQEDPFSPGFYK